MMLSIRQESARCLRTWAVSMAAGWLLLSCGAGLSGGESRVPSGAAPRPLVREIFVPFEDLSVLLEGQTERVFLTRKEYEALLSKAARAPADRAPRAVIPLRAEYRARIADGRATIQGTLEIEVLESGLHPVPLELAGVGIRQARLDGQAAAVARAEGQPILFVEGQGRRTLELDLVAPLVTSAAQQSLSFQLPTPAATRLHLTVPGNVEVRSGAAVAARRVDETAGVTQFELVPPRGPLSLVLSLNNRVLLEQSVVASRGVLVDEVTQAYERLHATFSLSVLHGAVDQFRFRLPAGFEVSKVATPLLARWVVQDAAEDQGRVLEVSLREPTADMVVVHVAATDNTVNLDSWKMPRLAPLDVSSHVGVVGLLLENRLELNSLQASELVAIDSDVLRGVLPDSVFQAEPGAPPVRPVVAYYAPQAAYELAAAFAKPEARIAVMTHLSLVLGDREQQVTARLVLQPQVEKLFAVDLTVPLQWTVTAISMDGGRELEFERFDGAEFARIQVRLPQGVAPDQLAHLVLQATHSSSEWLDNWTQREFDFPQFKVMAATTDRGAIAVQANDDLRVRPVHLQSLTPLDQEEQGEIGFDQQAATLAYRFEQPYAASFTVERIQPIVKARTFSFFRLQPQGLSAYYELIYDIERAQTRQLSLHLPQNTPAALSIHALDGVQVKEFSSQLADGKRTWLVDLSDRHQGQVRLAVEFQQRFESEEPQDFALPLVEAAGVAYQTSVVAVEGSAEFDVKLETNGRPIDVGELIDADYQVGRRLLGVFELAGSDLSAVVDIFRRPGYGLPAALVERAELVSLVSTSGRCQTAARYLLRTKAAYLQIVLPSNPTLWSASVDGKPATPQREGDSLLLSLPPSAQHLQRDVQIVYETPVEEVLLLGQIETTAPRLVVRGAEQGQGYEVPMADLQWHLVLPDGHRIVRSSGSVFGDQGPRRVSPVAVVAGVLYDLAGGVGPYYVARRRARPAVAMWDGAVTGAAQRTAADDFAAGEEIHKSEAASLDATVPSEQPSSAQVADKELESDDGLNKQLLGEPPVTRDSGRIDLGGMPAGGQETDADGKSVAGGRDKFWALEGVRSLQIALDQSGRGVTFRSMGVQPLLHVALIQQLRLDLLGWAVALTLGVMGLLITNASFRLKCRFVVGGLVFATVVPLAVGAAFDIDLRTTFDLAFYAACLLVPYYLLAGAFKWCASRWQALFVRRTAIAALVLWLAGSVLTAQVSAQNGYAEPTDLLRLIKPPLPIVLPEDAVIIPYDAADEAGPQTAEKVLVPYSQYVNLWNRAYPDRPIGLKPPPAAYAIAGGHYQATLDGGDQLLLSGRMEFDIYVDESVEIPLPLEGGVLTKATLDGQTARIRVVSTAESTPPSSGGSQTQQLASPPQPLVVVHAVGKGRKQFDYAIRLPLERSGGWRIARAKLPAAVSTALSLVVPQAQTEVRLAGVQDRVSYETERDQQTIETALNADGSFSLQWRPKVAVGQVDQTLTAQSTAVFDVQEDGSRMTWRLQLEFRRSQRETFTATVPADYLVEQVTGSNVRGWQAKRQHGTQQLEITLLKAATGSESFTVHLSRHAPLRRDQEVQLAVPVVSVPDAVLHQGLLSIRRSPLLELRTPRTTGLSRADVTDPSTAKLLESVDDESPLGIRAFQAFRFASTPFALQLAVRHYPARLAAEVQSLVKIAQNETTYEALIRLDVRDRPLFQVQIQLPPDLDLQEVTAPQPFEWVVAAENNQRLLRLQLQAGQQGTVAIVLRGRLARQPLNESAAVPQLVVLDVERQQGYIVVQADPAYDVRAEELRNCESVLLRRVYGWLDATQRQLARLALHYRSADFDARLRTTPRQPRVRSFTISNVRVTPREVEETIFLRFTIVDAGIRQVAFRLPHTLRDARITAPLLRQKTVTDVADHPDQVRVQLEFQDDIIDQLIVVVQQDRPLTADAQTAPIPLLETGETDQQFVVLESAGRDEVVVDSSIGLRELKRQQSEWRQLVSVLGNRITQAYLVGDSRQTPQLNFRTMARSAVETAGARIRLAETMLLVDGYGAYRGRQTYSVDNKTEQFLEIQLPLGSVLWTAKVAGEAVKPTQVPQAIGDRQLRVPLIKTAPGDLDYSVELKYGGRMSGLGSFRSVNFPLIHTVKINVEQSQVRLRLPRTHHWFSFAGSMRLVSEDDLLAEFLDYKTKQIQDLRRVLSSSKNEFTKARARNNLKQLGWAMQNYRSSYSRAGSEKLQQSLSGNNAAVGAAAREIEEVQQGLEDELATLNRDRLLDLGESQVTNRSTNVVTQLGSNFQSATRQVESSASAQDGPSSFNKNWLEGNQLQNSRAGQLGDLSDLSEQQAQQQSDKPRVRFSQSKKTGPTAAADQAALEGLYGLQPSLRQRRQNTKAAGPQPAPSSGRAGMGGRKGSAAQRRDGELREQLERYELQLQQQNAQAVPSANVELQKSMADSPWFGREPESRVGGMAGQAEAPEEMGLASLDVALPERGVEYLFTTPRGDIQIAARSVTAQRVQRLAGLLGIVGCLIALAVVARVVHYINCHFSRSVRGAILIILGSVSLLGFFPVAGLVAIVCGISLLIRGYFSQPRAAWS